MPMGIKEKLFNIQQEFKSGKDMYNDFAKFAYRNVENMLADLKPILKKYNCIITFNDDVVNVGNSNYIKTIVTLIDLNTDETISVSGVAKEDENRAGMCSGQMSGCSSSYCRKYALCGLLAVNEEKDLDALDNQPNQPKNDNKPTKSNIELLKEFCSNKKLETGIDIDKLTKFYNYYSTKDFKGKMNVEQLWNNWIKPKN